MRANIRPVLESLQRLYPKQLADSKWDNTGPLVDSLSQATEDRVPKVLLTIDLTTSVCDEALALGTDLVVAYHPFIFRGIKSISTKNPQHVSLLRLINAGVSVYSPHTAVDAGVSGNGDWLADGITNNGQNELRRITLNPVDVAILGQDQAGYGRQVELKEPRMLTDLVKEVKKHLSLNTVQLIRAPRHEVEPIRTVAMCAGSGGSVLGGADADLWLTGELGHHEMLFLKESGVSAIVCGHSNTERGFLPVFESQLKKDLASAGTSAELTISRTDRDPIEYV